MSDVETIDCLECDGRGWYADHESQCYATGDCSCSGVQTPCPGCGGSGQMEVVVVDFWRPTGKCPETCG